MLLALLLGRTAGAEDLGVLGPTYPIAEPPLQAVLLYEAAQVDWEAEQRRLAERAKRRLEQMPRVALGRALRTRIRRFEPVLTVDRDIEAPFWEQGRWRWRVAIRKGTRVNPLARGVRPQAALLVFDPADPAQMALARIAPPDDRVMLVAIGGNFPKLWRELQRPVYYLWPHLQRLIRVEATPSLVEAGPPDHPTELVVTEFRPAAPPPRVRARFGTDEGGAR